MRSTRVVHVVSADAEGKIDRSPTGTGVSAQMDPDDPWPEGWRLSNTWRAA